MKITLIVTIAFLLAAGVAVAYHTPQITPTISFEPLPTNQPSQEPTPSDSVVTVEPTITEESTATPAANVETSKSDGLHQPSSGLSDGLCSKPPCVPFGGPPNTGRGN